MPRQKRPAPEPTVAITVRFPAALRDAATKAADADDRSFNTFVVRAVQAAVDASKRR